MTVRFASCLISICLLATRTFTQVVYERTFPFEFPSIQYPIELSDTSTFSLGTNNECGGIGTRHIDVSGNELKEHAFWAEAFSSGVYWIGHDSVLVWAEEGAYDVGPDSFRVYIWTPDTIEKILSFDIRGATSNPRRYGAFLFAPDRLVYERTDTLYTFNLTTQKVEDSLTISGISFVHEFENAILVVSDSGTPILLDDHLNEIFHWQDPASIPFEIQHAGVLDSFLVGLAEFNTTSIHTINVYNETQQDVDLSAYVDQILDVQINKNWLFVKGMKNEDPYVLQLDPQFQLVEMHPIGEPELNFPLTYRYFPDRVYVWGWDGLAKYKANYRMSYTYKDAYPVDYVDIALDTMWVDSIVKYTQHYYIVYVKAIIRNHSPQVVHTVTMHYEEIPITFCDPGVYAGTFENRAILPDHSDTLSLTLFTYQVGSVYTQTFYVHHGNHQLDDHPDNNNFHLLHLLSSSEDRSRFSYKLLPNPFTDFLSVQEGSGDEELRLYNQAGRLVASGYGHLENLENLAPGIYFLHLLASSGLQVHKVIKSR